MANIHKPDSTFSFNDLSISQPTALQGGAYFTKIKYRDEPLYIQTCKCVTRQGLVETNKKAYIDLMFSKDDESIIEWFENLESTLQKLIYDKREIWFHNELDLSDIENTFTTPVRPYKGGKYHLVRINIAKNKTVNIPQYLCNIYDENENELSLQDVNDKTQIISVLEIQGIKFTSRNFQVEILGKQIMLLNDKPLFNSCIIKKNNYKDQLVNDKKTETLSNIQTLDNDENYLDPLEEIMNKNNSDNLEDNKISTEANNNTDKITLEDTDNTKNIIIKETNDTSNDNKEELKENIESNNTNISEIEEVNLEIPQESNTITLKNPNEVYYEIYKVAKEKAKKAKKEAIAAYLEAKKIKNTYMLDNLDSSDSSSEEEEYSDSESEDVQNSVNEIVEQLT